MSGYGKVISGGAKMSKGLTKGINDKLTTFADGHSRAQTIATAVNNAFKVRHLSDQTTNGISAGGKFKTVKERAKVQPS
jgi:ApbE superfamily uncharacterized protein (UPF0280 family)